ncbi:hypothetical protein TGAM01_v205514 [Trichoderma gamsii]|uniref:Uncharacterized protein n=1 Tax=Trichoderma gamsii TaxID=398673 RepID=A0A2P4ZMW2_9HYPO|nr:hypothetical protein TGAM01_v205514 [Trichoderma gamsii]PON25629.1 hypothetical protein TGAM01_v205514 [Trichoderma gamsii]
MGEIPASRRRPVPHLTLWIWSWHNARIAATKKRRVRLIQPLGAVIRKQQPAQLRSTVEEAQASTRAQYEQHSEFAVPQCNPRRSESFGPMQPFGAKVCSESTCLAASPNNWLTQACDDDDNDELSNLRGSPSHGETR